jgi:hypothetical protein
METITFYFLNIYYINKYSLYVLIPSHPEERREEIIPQW